MPLPNVYFPQERIYYANYADIHHIGVDVLHVEVEASFVLL